MRNRLCTFNRFSRYNQSLDDLTYFSKLSIDMSVGRITTQDLDRLRVTTEPSDVNILDLPDDISRRIILHLNARERVALANSHPRFNSLVFKDPELLRDLDFSKQVKLTSKADIRQYFDNEETCEHLRKLNLRNVPCIETGYVLENSIGKALNLVDINIHGTEFIDIWQLGAFLNPLVNLQRLSIDWPHMEKNINIPWCCKILQKTFSGLIYLSVKIEEGLLKVFVPTLRPCQRLRELSMIVNNPRGYCYDDTSDRESIELQNLEIVQYCGPYTKAIKERFVTLLPDPEKWADFQLSCDREPKDFYLEKNVEVCEELLACKRTETASRSTWNHFNLGWVLFPELLLQEVLKITYTNMPEVFCCLSKFMDVERCLLTIKDAKLLLRNPRHQISYLYISQPIEIDCDVHLVASAFENLTTLVLRSRITRQFESGLADTNFEKRRRRRASALPEEQYGSLNMDSSFKMLVENTPRLRDFTLINLCGYSDWDHDALYLISGWKSLQTLYLKEIRIKDGRFLIDIGKKCKHLEKIELCCMDYTRDTKEELLRMLRHCQNLMAFTIREGNIGDLSMIVTSLANIPKLKTVCVENENLTKHDTVSFMTQLLDQCPMLTRLHLILTRVPDKAYHSFDVSSDVKRSIDAFSHRNLQVCVIAKNHRYRDKKAGNIYEDTPHRTPFPHVWMED